MIRFNLWLLVAFAGGSICDCHAALCRNLLQSRGTTIPPHLETCCHSPAFGCRTSTSSTYAARSLTRNSLRCVQLKRSKPRKVSKDERTNRIRRVTRRNRTSLRSSLSSSGSSYNEDLNNSNSINRITMSASQTESCGGSSPHRQPFATDTDHLNNRENHREQAAPLPETSIDRDERGVQPRERKRGAKVDDPERMFALARSLHLRRHRSPLARELALALFRDSMRLRPGWKETDSRFAVDSGIDHVLAAFSRGEGFSNQHERDDKGRSEQSDGDHRTCTNTNTDTNRKEDADSNVEASTDVAWTDTNINTKVDVNTGADGEADPAPGRVNRRGMVGEIRGRKTLDAVECLRATLAGIGYTASRVQEKFGQAVGPAQGRRLPGPYYLRKSFDHTHAASVASLGPPRDGLDVAIRLFLLGLALSRAEVEHRLGTEVVEALGHLGMLGECPIDSSLVVSLVQLFPLDAEALSSGPNSPPGTYFEQDKSLLTPPHRGGSHTDDEVDVVIWNESTNTIRGSNHSGRDSERYTRPLSAEPAASTRENHAPAQRLEAAVEPHAPTSSSSSAVATANPGARMMAGVNRKNGGKNTPADATEESMYGQSPQNIALPAELVFATDWPPPGSSALTEEPVMYIGPDSIGLVQHAPRDHRSRAHFADESSEPTVDHTDEKEIGRDRVDAEGKSLSKVLIGGAMTRGSRNQADGIAKEGQKVATAVRKDTKDNGKLERRGVETILDLCCGSGIQGIAAAVLREGKASVTCVDINPRAVRFARFNALLNGLDDDETSFRAIVGDLYDDLDASLPRTDDTNVYKVESVSGSDTKKRPPSTSYKTTAGRLRFDLILANPPFVPVPPKMDTARRRYDVYASGGASGEDVIEGLFRGAVNRLRPGGMLAVVSELANPRSFGDKIRHWVGDDGGIGADCRESPSQSPPHLTEKVSTLRSSSGTGAPLPEERDTSGASTADVHGKAAAGWTGVVFHEKEPWTNREYANRRAGSDREAQGWETHLARMGIEEMAPGFVFVRRRLEGLLGADMRRDERRVDQGDGDGTMVDTGTVARAAADGRGEICDDEAARKICLEVEVRGIDKLWAPHNVAAVDNTRDTLWDL